MECKLQVWKLAHQLTLDVYEVSKNFPSSEKFGLTNQVRRSSSKCSNKYNRRAKEAI
ncbi:four helix bundle protein [Polaribacter atrinae]|uniref:four helix bundle protein n=1 Tax=Polaribacter atrinae TaxID=1333662 RepID=UPI0030F99EF0